jgi:CO/xanthine dehydrogenase FAD-binding subunit
MVALVVEVDEDGAIGRAGVAVGACSPVARRLPALEGALVGRSLGQPIEDAVRADHLAPLAPIDDIRASADYRLDAVLTLIRRGLGALGKAA